MIAQSWLSSLCLQLISCSAYVDLQFLIHWKQPFLPFLGLYTLKHNHLLCRYLRVRKVSDIQVALFLKLILEISQTLLFHFNSFLQKKSEVQRIYHCLELTLKILNFMLETTLSTKFQNSKVRRKPLSRYDQALAINGINI